MEHLIHLRHQQVTQQCECNYGFCSSYTKNIKQNFDNALNNPNSSLFTQPINLTFHNLCKQQRLPTGSKELLGLNLKFCLATKPLPNEIKRTVIKMAKSIRTQQYLVETGIDNNSTYIKQIYKKNPTWNPPPATLLIEDKITEFEKALKEIQQNLFIKNKYRKITNLNPIQSIALQQLKRNTNITIKPTDKNLGPAAMDTEDYITQILKEHLLTADYNQLSKTEAYLKMDQLKTNFKNLIQSNLDVLSKPEVIFFQRSLASYHRLPLLYGLPKVHKTPVSLRPVVSTSGSLSAIFSTWLDYKMKELLPLIKSHIHNSFQIIEDFKTLELPENALLFSADAISMYTNINTDIGITSIKDFLEINKIKISQDFPHSLFLQVLELVMRNNIFAFADTYWHQRSGTAMGTPAACAYAMITFGHYENTTILQDFTPNLLYYKRYIDDVVGIWLPPEQNNTALWSQFKEKLNGWGQLNWKIEDPSKHTVFLDLELTINRTKITTKTYQKNMNLYLYIPPFSAHPPSCFKGLVTGELRRYWLQNSPEDFQEILCKFIDRLLQRGHDIHYISYLMEQAAISLDRSSKLQKTNDTDSDNILYIHRTYHPIGPQRHDIRILYQKILEPHLNFDKMTVAISRPPNLRDILTKAKVIPPPGIEVSTIIEHLKNRT